MGRRFSHRQVLAARLRVAVDEQLGDETPDYIRRMADAVRVESNGEPETTATLGRLLMNTATRNGALARAQAQASNPALDEQMRAQARASYVRLALGQTLGEQMRAQGEPPMQLRSPPEESQTSR